MPRPLTTLPKCNDFNQIVTLDLKQWGTKYILWMVCSFMRFIKGVVISNKEAKTVMDAVIKNWNCNFGIPSTRYCVIMVLNLKMRKCPNFVVKMD